MNSPAQRNTSQKSRASPTSRPRRLWWRTGILVVALLLLGEGGAYFVAKQIVAPPRREILEYHERWLSGKMTQALEIERGVSPSSGIAYAVVTPRAEADLSYRGAKVRQQVADLLAAKQAQGLSEWEGISLPEWGEIRATVMILHGRKGRKEDLLPLADRFCALGFRCVHVDMPAHGDSFGQGSVAYGTRAGEEDYAARALAEVASLHGFEQQPAFLWGMSMGGAYAASELRQEGSPWRAAMIVSGFDALDEVIEEQAQKRVAFLGEVFAPLVKWNLAQFFQLETQAVRPVDWLAQARCPVMVVHGREDELFALERGRALFEAIQGQEKEWLEVREARHGNVLSTEQEIMAPMGLWFLRFVE